MAKRPRFVAVEDILEDLDIDDSLDLNEPMLPGSDDEFSDLDIDFSDEGIRQQ